MAKKPPAPAPASSTGGGDGGGVVATAYPWSRCIAGSSCKIKEDSEIILLECLHAICSDTCLAKLRSEVEPGEPFNCGICNVTIEPQGLERKKIVPQQEFAKKTAVEEATLTCGSCYTGDPAVCYCPDCDASLCGTCQDLHTRLKVFREHGALEMDLSERKAMQMAKAEEAATKCRVHVTELLTHVCINCQQKICEECVEQHEGHAVVDIKKGKERLTAKLDMVRYVERWITLAVAEMKKKREDFLSTEWEHVVSDINEQFSTMMAVLLRRQNEVQHEARTTFMKQMEELQTRACNAELVQLCSGEFVKAAESVLSEDMDDVASINLLKHSKAYLEFVEETEKKLREDFDRFVDKGWHFQFDIDANVQAREYIQRYCQLEYKYQPQRRFAIAKTKAANHARNIGSSKSHNNDPDNSTTNDYPISLLRRCLISPSPGVIEQGASLKDGMNSKQKLTVGPSQMRTRRSSLTASTSAPDEGESRTEDSSVSVVTDSQTPGELLPSESTRKAPPLTPSKWHGLQQGKSKTNRSGSDSNNQLKTSKEKSKIFTEPMSSPDEDDHPIFIRNVKGSTGSFRTSLSSDTAGPGPELGKRERKKKSLPPGFVDIDQALQQRQKPEATEAAAAVSPKTPVRRRSRSASRGPEATEAAAAASPTTPARRRSRSASRGPEVTEAVATLAPTTPVRKRSRSASRAPEELMKAAAALVVTTRLLRGTRSTSGGPRPSYSKMSCVQREIAERSESSDDEESSPPWTPSTRRQTLRMRSVEREVGQPEQTATNNDELASKRRKVKLGK